MVKCNDQKIRICRISEEIKRRMWIRVNDKVLVSPWDFRSDRADIVWRYITAHADRLKEEGCLLARVFD